MLFQTCEIDASVENFGGGCGSSYKYTCTAQESDYPNCTLHDPMSDLDCESGNLSQNIGVRCQTREETNTVVNDATEASLICSNEALAVLTGLLAAVLVVVTMGWIVSCVYLRRRVRQR